MHDCRCLDGAYGSAAAASSALTLAGQSEACTACAPQAFCLASESYCMGALPARVAASLGCSPGGADDGYYVDANAVVQQCAVGTSQLAGGNGVTGCPACTSQAGCATDGTTCLPLTTTDPVTGLTGDLPLKLECVAPVAGLYYLVGGVTTAIVCTTPADTSGYAVSAESLVLGASPFSVTAACATGYEGTAAAAACTADATAYTLSGCAPIVCTTPAATTGFAVVETNLDLSAGAFGVTATCDAGYTVDVDAGYTVAAAACTTSGDYTLSGCTAQCTQPVSIAGYTVDAEIQLDVLAGFDVVATCDTGYEGTAVATACTAHNTAYTLSGCAPIVCTSPPATTGYVIPSPAYNLDLSTGAFDAAVSCVDGFSGTAVATACTTSGSPYTVSGCVNQCAQQVGTTLSCTSSSDCVYTTTVMNQQELTAEVELSVTGDASFARATASASASVETTTAQSSTEQISLAPDTCKFYVLYVSNDYSNSGCASSMAVLARNPGLDAEGRCPVSAEYTPERPECSASHINAFISQCGLLPAPAPPPAASAPAPAASAAVATWRTASVVRTMAGVGALWLWSGLV